MHTDWEKRYQTNDTGWDKGSPAPPLLEFLDSRPLVGRVLVPGCGYGHDAAAIAARSIKECEVVGLDIAPSAIRGASQRYSLPNLSFSLGDFLNFPTPPSATSAFDALFEHTLFCAIHPALRERYSLAAANALRPGGLFLAIFYMSPDPARGPGPPFGCTEDELDALFSAHFDTLERWIPKSAFPGREGREAMRLMVRKPPLS